MRPPESVVLVEGPNDLHVVQNLLKIHLPSAGIKVKVKNGIDNLIQTLHVELRDSELRRLAIVVDADVDIQARWDSITHRLTGSGYLDVPRRPDPAGSVMVQTDKPSVGVWIMPDNRTDGMLEDFVAALVPANDDLFPAARQAVESIPLERRRFVASRRAKADIHTWLAWQPDPGRPLGLAIACTYLDPNAPSAIAFLNWIRRLLTS